MNFSTSRTLIQPLKKHSPILHAGLSWRAWGALSLLFGLFVVAVVRKAWVTDDAYITFRSIDNLINGYGLTWNPPERVQVFTHPLWMMTMTILRSLSSEFFYTSIFANLALSVGAVLILIFFVARSAHAAALSLVALTLSRAFTDFSTSGLENALTHFLLAIFFLCITREGATNRSARLACFVAALCMLNRLDISLLVLPVLFVQLNELKHRQRWEALCLGFLPLFLWETFAVFYYGFPLPNTAYAKLNTGLPLADLMTQGGHYLANSLHWDTVTLVFILGGSVVALLYRRNRNWPWAVGLTLYLMYVIRVGGDFMSGRFLTPPLWVAVMLIAYSGLIFNNARPQGNHRGARLAWAGCLVLLLLMLTSSYSPFRERQYGDTWDAAIDNHGIADERTFYNDASLRHAAGRPVWPQPNLAADAENLKNNWPRDQLLARLHLWLFESNDPWPPSASIAQTPGFQRLVMRGGVGFLGYYIGPKYYVLDYHAICNPLLARLPALVPDPVLAGFIPRLASNGWRPGHFTRVIPAGYALSIATGNNHLLDPSLAEYYDKLQLITRGPLWDAERLRTIWSVNIGRYDKLTHTAQNH